MKTFNEIIQKSSDSYLESCIYKDNRVLLRVNLDEIDKLVELSINTNHLFLNIPESTEIPYRTCFFELLELKNILKVSNGIYSPASNFGDFMKEKRDNLNLAYGLRSSQFKFLFSLIGSEKLVSFVISDISDIEFKFYPSSAKSN